MGNTTVFTMYSGLRTIGGVNFSVTYGNDRVVMECGNAYDPATALFDGKILQRSKNWIKDNLRAGLLPKIDGLYRKEDLLDFPLISAEESSLNTAVFVTHLHLDHMANMGAIAPNVPVYLHKNAQIIESALETTGLGVRTNGRGYTHFEPNVPIKVGAIEVLPILCRNTSYYDFAFLITTPDGTIHWTGDLSLHGTQADKTLKQLALLEKSRVDVMLCDCTTFMDSTLKMTVPSLDPKDIMPTQNVPDGLLSDEEYYAALHKKVCDCKGLIVFNHYQREMDDVEKLLMWAKETNRICAFEPDAAYIVYKFFNIKPCVYYPDDALTESRRNSPWGQELLENSTEVTLEDIYKNPRGYMVQNSYEHILELFSLPNENGTYIHADGIPIGSFDPSYANMVRIVERTGFRYVTFFCENYFGHGYPQQVKWFVDRADPKVLIPCHGYNPERLLPNNGIQLLPKPYKKYSLINHELCELGED